MTISWRRASTSPRIWNDQVLIRFGHDLGAHALTFAADNYGHAFKVCVADIGGAVRQRGDRHGDAGGLAGRGNFFPSGCDHIGAENRAHGSTHHLMAEGVCAAFQQHHGDI